jgi:cholesterol oxidase
MKTFDVIVIGSGFGGAVAACRLADSGARVLVLERGRRWVQDEYPREPKDAWIYEHTNPEKYNGWLDVRFYRGMSVVQGAGVGGGSQCYSSVLLKANADCFDQGWVPELTYQELRPYYEKVSQMLSVTPIPDSQYTYRHKLLHQTAYKLGMGQRFSSVPLALSFDPEWNYNLDDPFDLKHSRRFVNPQGIEQGTCIHLGDCDIGCKAKAKNTLDLNYIAKAEHNGAEVRPLHIVRSIEPCESGYKVIFDRIHEEKLIRGEEFASKVIIAAGSLGSTELLLRCRDQYRTLPNLSPVLGYHWSANGNVISPDFYDGTADIKQSLGPTISGMLEFMDGSQKGEQFIIEDDGFPNLLLNALTAKRKVNGNGGGLLGWLLQRHLQRGVSEINPLRNVMMWLGAGVDAGDGQLYLGQQWLKPGKSCLQLKWDSSASVEVVNAILAMQQRLSKANDGKLYVPLYWRLLRSMVTVHPLGGCRIGKTHDTGVVDHQGEVFGYPSLYVADGAIIPKSIGRNPSMTIAALSERISHLMTS